MNKGDIIEIEITDVSEQGQGIGKFSGLVIFVKNALFGEIVKARLDKLKKSYALATCIKVVKKSEHEVLPICPHEECGGCIHRKLNYETQLKLKQSQVMEKLYRLGGVPKELSFDIIGADNPYHYRNKARMPVSTGGIRAQKDGIIRPASDHIVGFYKMGTHDVVNCKACRLQPPIVMEIAAVLEKFMKSDKLTAYDEKSDRGLFRHLIVKIAEATGEIMVIFVINGKGIPNANKLIKQLDNAVNAFPDKLTDKSYSLESVYANTLKGKSNKNMGEISKLLAGKTAILEKLGNLYFEISPSAFYQVNPAQTIKLYDKVLEFADLKANDNILDLYCGVGSIGIYCAKHIKDLAKDSEIVGQVVGIEIVKEAVTDANRNAVINNLVNARFICGKAEYELENLAFNPNIIILDPPRSGCRPSLFQNLEKIGAEKIIYISCEPATLSRDIATLISMGYKVEKGSIIDMFPHTGRIETVALLSKLNIDKHINIKINLDEPDLTSAESKAN